MAVRATAFPSPFHKSFGTPTTLSSTPPTISFPICQACLQSPGVWISCSISAVWPFLINQNLFPISRLLSSPFRYLSTVFAWSGFFARKALRSCSSLSNPFTFPPLFLAWSLTISERIALLNQNWSWLASFPLVSLLILSLSWFFILSLSALFFCCFSYSIASGSISLIIACLSSGLFALLFT